MIKLNKNITKEEFITNFVDQCYKPPYIRKEFDHIHPGWERSIYDYVSGAKLFLMFNDIEIPSWINYFQNTAEEIIAEYIKLDNDKTLWDL